MIKYNKYGVVYMMKTYDVSWDETKKSVQDVISKYIYYVLSVDVKSVSSINSDFTLSYIEEDVPMEYTKITLEEQNKRIDYINYFRFAFNKMTSEDRKIIYWTYLDSEDKYDDRFIANSLGFSLGYYYKKKKDTLIRFAFSLGVEKK